MYCVRKSTSYETMVIYYTVPTRICKILRPIKVELDRLFSNKLLIYVRNMLMQ